MSALLTVADVVAAQARLQPATIGARDSRRALTVARWHERAYRLANALAGLGLAKGDRVAILAYNCIEWMELYVGLAAAGFVAVPINFRLVPSEIAYIATNCDARAFIVQDDLIDRAVPGAEVYDRALVRGQRLGRAAEILVPNLESSGELSSTSVPRRRRPAGNPTNRCSSGHRHRRPTCASRPRTHGRSCTRRARPAGRKGRSAITRAAR